jgi:EAL domain-containing protein (putative c-di-GMP-specific phosphodiesterase class I)
MSRREQLGPVAPARVTALTAVGVQADLRAAIEADQLVLHYQPIVGLTDGQPVGVEALVRWDHPVAGLLTPDAFLPALEHAPVIADLTRWVLRTACTAAASWPNWTMAVNVSARDLTGPTLLNSVESALTETGMDADRLVLEVTETAVVQDVREAARTLEALREQGVAVDLDDFGTGYSSMLYLRDLPVTGVKIDREFVSRIDHDNGDDRAIVSSLLTLAEAIGLSTIAEGVETDDQRSVLSTLGCSFAQGYLWSRPQPAYALSGIYRDGLRQSAPQKGRPARFARPGGDRVHKRAMNMLRQGASLETIAAALNAAGERTNTGMRWHRASVARLISGDPTAGSTDPETR